MIIRSFDDFEKFVDNDRNTRDLRIFRFINIENIESWLKIKNFLSTICVNTIKLSSFCTDSDLTPVIGKLYAEIETIKGNTLLLPISEHLRLLDTSKAIEIIKSITGIQYVNNVYSSKAHLYILMYQMKENLNKVIEQDKRIANYVIFIEDGKSDEYSLTILPKEFQSYKSLFRSQKDTTIEGYKNYLINWEEAPRKSVILYTDNAKIFKKKVSLGNVKILTGPCDIINYFKLLPYKIEESLGSEWLWNELLKKIQREGTLSKNLSLLLFGVPTIVPRQLLSKWGMDSDFEKWLSWLWFKFEIKDGYLVEVIKKSNNYQDLIRDIYCGIFDYTIDDYDTYFKNYSERKELLNSIGIEAPPTIFWDRLDSIPIGKRVFYLTDSTQKEREKIISLIGEVGLNNRLNSFLKNAYPVLSAYLDPYVFNKEIITDYFMKYKKNKVVNCFPVEFIEEVERIAEKKGIWWELEPRKKLIDDAYDEESHIYWVDALGVEYLSLIEHILNNRYRDIDYYVDIGYANLPTITELNKDFIESREYSCFRGLDTLKHQGDYPQCIEKELELIEKSITQAIQKLEKYRKVIIISDHGSSRGGNSI